MCGTKTLKFIFVKKHKILTKSERNYGESTANIFGCLLKIEFMKDNF